MCVRRAKEKSGNVNIDVIKAYKLKETLLTAANHLGETCTQDPEKDVKCISGLYPKPVNFLSWLGRCRVIF